MSIHPEGKPCSNLGEVLVVNDPAAGLREIVRDAMTDTIKRVRPSAWRMLLATSSRSL